MRSNYLAIFYLTVGIASVLFFSWTGSYLQATYPDKLAMEMGFRVMLRSRHIFLLLVGLIEVGIGTYIQPARSSLFHAVQWLATVLLLTAHGLFIWAFFYEVSPETVPRTPVLHWATYLTLASLIVHCLTRFERITYR